MKIKFRYFLNEPRKRTWREWFFRLLFAVDICGDASKIPGQTFSSKTLANGLRRTACEYCKSMIVVGVVAVASPRRFSIRSSSPAATGRNPGCGLDRRYTGTAGGERTVLGAWVGARLFTVRERSPGRWKQTRFWRKPIKTKNAVACGGWKRRDPAVGGECRTCRNNGRDSSSDEIMLLLCTSGRAEKSIYRVQTILLRYRRTVQGAVNRTDAFSIDRKFFIVFEGAAAKPCSPWFKRRL